MSNVTVVLIVLAVILALVFVVAPIIIVAIATSNARRTRRGAERVLRIRK